VSDTAHWRRAVSTSPVTRGGANTSPFIVYITIDHRSNPFRRNGRQSIDKLLRHPVPAEMLDFSENCCLSMKKLHQDREIVIVWGHPPFVEKIGVALQVLL
jgi:hypothetical protein